MLPPIRYIMEDLKAPLLQEIRETLDPLEDIFGLIQVLPVAEEPPLAMKKAG